MFNGAAPEGGIRRRLLQAGGHTLEVLESCGQGMPILACHGNSGEAALFAPLLESETGRRHHIVAVSFPGHGSSARATDTAAYALPALAALLGDVVRHYAWPRYLLLGHSLGGHALLQALGRLDGAAGLMLVSAPPLALPALDQTFLPDPSGGCLFKGALSETETDAFAACFTAPGQQDLRARLARAIGRTDPAFRPALGASIAAGLLADEREQLAAARMPVALAAGDADRFLRQSYYATVPAQRLWRGRVAWFEGCGHAPHLEAPQRFASLLSAFAADCGAGAPATGTANSSLVM